MKNSLEIKSLVCSFTEMKQNTELNLSLPSAKRVALLGLNGAGKSTLIRHLVGESKSPSDSICFFSHTTNSPLKLSNDEQQFKQKLGYQSDTMLSIANMTGLEYLQWVGQTKGLSEEHITQRIGEINQQWPILDLLQQEMSNLSKGNLQKLMISQAFLNNPEFVFFDEPCQSLDPLEQDRFNKMLKELCHFELCLFSTHNVAHAIDVADEIILIHRAKIIYHFKSNSVNNYLIVCQQPTKILTHVLEQLPLHVRALSKQFYCIEQASPSAIDKLLQDLTHEKIKIDFCLAEKQAIVPLFRLLASGEINFDEYDFNEFDRNELDQKKLGLGETG